MATRAVSGWYMLRTTPLTLRAQRNGLDVQAARSALVTKPIKRTSRTPLRLNYLYELTKLSLHAASELVGELASELLGSKRAGGSLVGGGAETDLLADLGRGNLLLKEGNNLGNVGGDEGLALGGEGAEDGASL